MDWAVLITKLIEMFMESKKKQGFSSNQDLVRMIRQRPLIARLAIRSALKEQGMRGIALHNAIDDAMDEIDKTPDPVLLDFCNQ